MAQATSKPDSDTASSSGQWHKTPGELLATPVQFIKGVGPQRGELLARMELYYASDVLFNFPRDYEDLSDLRKIADLEEDKPLSVRGVVEEVDLRETGPGKSILGVLISQHRDPSPAPPGKGAVEASDHLRAVWFNQPYLQQQFRAGQQVLLFGKARHRGFRWEMAHPRVQQLEEDEEMPQGLLPIYPLTEGLNQGQMRRITRGVLDTCLDAVDEVFPPEFLAAHNLAPIHEALTSVHFPPDRAALDRARIRLVYQELLVLQLALALRRQAIAQQGAAPVLEATAKIDARIRRRFPFELTTGQNQAIAEIAADMARRQPMNRLLQGEVGSGKTVVALYATLLAVAHGCQAAIMAPTEVLARQHAEVLGKFLEVSQVRTALLSGGQGVAERRDTLEAIRSGEVNVVIGTQAIVESGAEFAKLGLVVIDEQHKFGVRQRASLKQAGQNPHYLVMTATPIPRTVAMTLFGDLDVSTLRDAPPGRQQVHTYLAEEAQRAKWWEFFCKKLREGRQGFVVVPLVEESANWQAANLNETFERLAHGELAEFRLGLLHGRLASAEKEAAMADFRAGRTQVLICTSVVEVGIDVPNATLMTIDGAERFGLAQLHQLRGRISRGSHPGYCCLLAEAQTEESRERLQALVKSTDGFELSEIDFQLRGPGELVGTRQHGLPPLFMANLQRDGAVVELARQDAQQLVAADPGLTKPEYARLRRMVLAKYGKALELGDVG
jgi:ATP-dependent DNA helicase RecG